MILKRIACFLGMAVGTVSVVLAIVTYSLTTGIWPDRSDFDKLKYYQESLDQARFYFSISFALGSLLMVGGVALISFFLYKLAKDISSGRANAFAQPVSMPAGPSGNAPLNYGRSQQTSCFCPQCGAKNSGSAVNCNLCGARLYQL